MFSFSSFLTANRVAAAVAVLTGLAAFIVGVVGVLPGSWQNTALAVAGLAKSLVTVIVFLRGSQKSEALAREANMKLVHAEDKTPVDEGELRDLSGVVDPHAGPVPADRGNARAKR